MKTLQTIRNYLCYCGIEKSEFDDVKKDAYVSNFKVWRILHCLMTAIFGLMFLDTLFDGMLTVNKTFYLIAFIYSAIITVIFFLIKKESVFVQVLIFLSISFLLLFSAFITQNKPDMPATTFFAMLLITPMFMIDKPCYMGILLTLASTGFLIWMHLVKPFEIWRIDFSNAVIFTVVSFFIHMIFNSLRIKEFVLTRKLNIQKDTDELTGLKNKGALTRAINEFLEDDTKNKGILFLMDVDGFKAINDTFGHDFGDSVIYQFGAFLRDCFQNDEIVGRFGGDEFILFIKDTDDADTAGRIAADLVARASDFVAFPDDGHKISVSIGIALYHGEEKNYSEIFKKADMALYKVKSDRTISYTIHE